MSEAPGAPITGGAAGAAAVLVPRLDHVVVNVRDRLDEAAENYRRLGFSIMPRGHHTLGSSNHLAIFGETYLELFGYEPGGDAKTPDLWTDPTGLTGLVFKGGDPQVVYDVMKAGGLDVREPLHFSRPVDTGDGPKPARFSVVSVPPGHIRNGRSFFCSHHTPELVWMPQWQTHPNGAHDIVGLVIASEDPARTALVYQTIFGAGVTGETPEGLRFSAGTAVISIMKRKAAEARFGDAIISLADGEDHMVALRISTDSLDMAREALRAGSVTPITRDDALLVPHRAANGVAIEFVRQDA